MVQIGDVLHSENTSYQITGFNGMGAFSQVAKCVNLNTDEVVAVKIPIEEDDDEITQSELAVLETVRALDSDRDDIVAFTGKFPVPSSHLSGL